MNRSHERDEHFGHDSGAATASALSYPHPRHCKRWIFNRVLATGYASYLANWPSEPISPIDMDISRSFH
jgi:hypothetical protein